MANNEQNQRPGRGRFRRVLWRRDPATFGAGLTVSISSPVVPMLGRLLGTVLTYDKGAEEQQAFLGTLDGGNFNGLVLGVAASGFLTDSYNLFASNVILPALAFVYWGENQHDNALAFNLLTLAGSAVGQVSFGVAADIYGRRSLYGVELIIVILSTIGLLQCSPGFTDPKSGQHTWSITPWLLVWRFTMGVGIGAEYPLSACIAAEWSSTKSRGRMLSAVFLMQPIGQFCAYAVGLITLRYLGPSPKDMDVLWRTVIGIGAFPTLVALIFRLTIPESGRYTHDVLRNPKQAEEDTARVYPTATPPDTPEAHDVNPMAVRASQFGIVPLREYLIRDRNWILLLGTCACWLLLDFAFFGLGFNNPSTLAKIWTDRHLQYPPDAPGWMTSSSVLNTTIDGIEVINMTFADGTIADGKARDGLIHQVLEQNMLHAIYTVSIASILGSVLMIWRVNKHDRVKLLVRTFLLLAAILLAASISFPYLFHQGGNHIVLIVFWVLISFLMAFGPNTLTFMIPAEVFPTKYRCTFYGTAAASGKIGAILVQCVILSNGHILDPNSTGLRWLLLGFAFCMLLGAGFAWRCIPSVQRPSTTISRNPPFENRTLEDLAPGWRRRETLGIPLQTAR